LTLFATRLTMRTAFNGEEEHCGGRSSAGRAPDCDSGGRGFKPHRPPQSSKHVGCVPETLFSRVMREWWNW
jgi:hypothetical protein